MTLGRRRQGPWRSLVLSLAAALGVSGFADAQTVAPTVALGTTHAVALRNNGDVLTWGGNGFCALGRVTPNGTDATPTLLMRNVKEISAAEQHSFALTDDGKVYTWGKNTEGSLGTGDANDVCYEPVIVEALSDKAVAHIATGYNFTMALTSAGDLYCAGDNAMGQCPPAKTTRLLKVAPVGIPALAGNVVSVVAGTFHTLATTKDGRLFAFGRGRDGQLGNGGMANGQGFVTGLTDVVSFAVGTWHSAAVKSDGTVWTWGNNSKAQLCDGTTTNRAVPTRVTTLPPAVRIVRVSAGGHATMLEASDGAVYVCGDNLTGALGVNAPVASLPAPVSVPAVRHQVLTISGPIAALSVDACTVRMAGDNDTAVVNGASNSPATRTFAVRAGVSLCAPRSATRLADVVVPAPHGGASGCWTPYVESDGSNSPKFAGLRQAMLAAETLMKRNPPFVSPPQPSRFRTSLSAGPYEGGGARMHIKVAPELKWDGTRLWTGVCDVIPQIDRIGGSIAHISIFFNGDVGDAFVRSGQAPKYGGQIGGYPIYNDWVVVTRNGRLPWVPQTLKDKLDAEATRRQRALDDWKKDLAGRTSPNMAAAQNAYESMKKTDPAGAEQYIATIRQVTAESERLQRDVYPKRTAELEKQVRDLQQYRASFSPQDLEAPAVSGNPTGALKRKHDTDAAALRALTPDEQKQVDDLGQQGRALERQAQAETAARRLDEGARLRAQANELAVKARTIRDAHAERIALMVEDVDAQFALAALKPGDKSKALAYKPDPTFSDPSAPDRIRMISVYFSFAADPRATDPRSQAILAWGQRVKDAFDFQGLAALLQ